MNTCNTCDFWIRRGPTKLNKNMQYFGTCENTEKLHSRRDPRRWFKDDLITDSHYESPTIYTGEDFGCIHWTREDEDGSTCEAT
jgi:hypothetical protein